MRAPADDGLALDAAQYINALLLNAPSADMRALWAWRAAIDRDLSTAVMLLFTATALAGL